MAKPIELNDGTRIPAGKAAPAVIRSLQDTRYALKCLEEHMRDSAYELALDEAMRSLRAAVNWLEEAVWISAQPDTKEEGEAWTEEALKGLSMSGSNELTTELQPQC